MISVGLRASPGILCQQKIRNRVIINMHYSGRKLLRIKGKKAEYALFQLKTSVEIFPDPETQIRIPLPIMLQDVFQSLIKADNFFVPYSLISIIDYFPGREKSIPAAIGIMIAEQNMFGHDFGYFRIAKLKAYFSPFAGMVTVSIQTGCFGDIMQQSTGHDKITVGNYCR